MSEIKNPPPTKLVEVRLVGMLRVEYMEVVEVPADITEQELGDLVAMRYDQVDAGNYQSDPEYWEKGTCEAINVDSPEETPLMAAYRTDKGLRIESVAVEVF